MNLHGPIFILAVAMATVPLAAQDNAGKTRLDEFETPASNSGVSIDQVGNRTRPVESGSAPDQAILLPPRPAVAPIATAQLSGTGETLPPVQLAPPGDRNAQPIPSLTQRSEGRPGAVVRLEGKDRCDPQDADASQREACKQVIELRSSEFSATTAPTLSAEQKLLAQQFQVDPGSLAQSPGLERQSRVGNKPDNEIMQELGFLTTPTQEQPATSPVESADDASLAEALKGMLIEMGVPGLN